MSNLELQSLRICVGSPNAPVPEEVVKQPGKWPSGGGLEVSGFPGNEGPFGGGGGGGGGGAGFGGAGLGGAGLGFSTAPPQQGSPLGGRKSRLSNPFPGHLKHSASPEPGSE